MENSEQIKNYGTGQRVVVAMSGGVDSSMAAALLVDAGYEVIGIMLRLWAEAGPAGNRCCTPDAVADARRVADALEIPFYVRDYKEVFKTTVVDYFTQTYARGLTPNPCLICNRHIRFGRLLDEALAIDARMRERISTGRLNRWLERAVGDRPPPAYKGRAVKIYYGAHAALRPPTFSLIVSSGGKLHSSYERYLMNLLRKEFDFEGVPIRFRVVAKRRRNTEVRRFS